MKVSSVSVIAAVYLEQKAVLSVSVFLCVTADEMFGNSIFTVGNLSPVSFFPWLCLPKQKDLIVL